MNNNFSKKNQIELLYKFILREKYYNKITKKITNFLNVINLTDNDIFSEINKYTNYNKLKGGALPDALIESMKKLRQQGNLDLTNFDSLTDMQNFQKIFAVDRKTQIHALKQLNTAVVLDTMPKDMSFLMPSYSIPSSLLNPEGLKSLKLEEDKKDLNDKLEILKNLIRNMADNTVKYDILRIAERVFPSLIQDTEFFRCYTYYDNIDVLMTTAIPSITDEIIAKQILYNHEKTKFSTNATTGDVTLITALDPGIGADATTISDIKTIFKEYDDLNKKVLSYYDFILVMLGKIKEFIYNTLTFTPVMTKPLPKKNPTDDSYSPPHIKLKEDNNTYGKQLDDVSDLDKLNMKNILDMYVYNNSIEDKIEEFEAKKLNIEKVITEIESHQNALP